MATELLPRMPIESHPAFSAILRDQETFGTGAENDLNDRLNSSFDRLMLQSGIGIVMPKTVT